MNSSLLSRELGTLTPKALQQIETNRLLLALQAAPGIRFDGTDGATSGAGHSHGCDEGDVWAHRAGVNCVTIDKFEGRYMLSGGAESSIKLWDLESAETTLKSFTYRPAGRVQKYDHTVDALRNGTKLPLDHPRPTSSASRICLFTPSTR